jgi:glycosyltransferase involved in cell wall biosynthesis
MPIRALHVVGCMTREGVQTWLLNVMRRMPRREVAVDLMVHTDAAAAYDSQVESMGATIHRNAHPHNVVRYVRRLREILGAVPRYDVVHSHVHHYSGIVLAVAARAAVPVRIAHCHSDTREADAASSWPRRMYLSTASRLIRRHATAGFACSDAAGQALFGPRWSGDERWAIMQAGIDAADSLPLADRAGVRREFDVPADATVLIHVGRFDPVKNQAFLIDVLAAARARRPDLFLLLVGTGPLEGAVAARARERGVHDRIRFCGSRTDVPRLLAAADVFVFPSIFEGAPLACLEAQAVGLPLVIADTINPGVIVAPGSVVQVPLATAPPWVDAIERALHTRPDAHAALAAVRTSAFNVAANADLLMKCYRAGLVDGGAHPRATGGLAVGA